MTGERPVLVPQPRSVDLGRERVAAAVPGVARDPSLPAEGYRLRIGTGGTRVDAADAAGEAHALRTLAQLARTHDGRLPVGTVEDWPDLAVRGVMLDISRDKVPTMATLETLVDRLAGWKVNQLQLYMEHTFAYADHEEVWRHASPLTPDEVRDLDLFCRRRHVELVPNQNCLGHFDRWLAHDRYRPLALCPDGWTSGDGRRRRPTTLDPANPEAFALVRRLLGELLPNFTSTRAHVGLDEPWELPAERIDDYVAWLARLRAAPELDGREMLVWGDILGAHADRGVRLPDGVTVCEWGYEDWSPLDQRAAALAAAGTPFWTCPGTSSWDSVAGRWTNMRGNILAAARAALDHGGSGLLNTDWGDQGHLQPLAVSEPGLAFGAAAAWCPATNADLDLEAVLDVHVFADAAGQAGALLHLLGDLHRLVTPQFPNCSTLVLHGYYPQAVVGEDFTAGLVVDELDAVDDALADASTRVEAMRSGRDDAGQVVDELRWVIAYVAVLVADARARIAGNGSLGSIPAGARAALADRLEALVGDYRRLWLARNRPGGLDDSAAWLEHLLDAYRSGHAADDWGGW